MNKLKHLLIAGLIMTLPATVNAQKGTINIGAHGGLNFSKLCCASMEINEDYNLKEGPAFGLTAAYGINSWLSIAAELNYTTLGGQQNGMQPVVVGTSSMYADFDNKKVLNYLELPVMARATFGNRIKYYADLGVFGGYLLKAKQNTSGSSTVYLDKNGTLPFVSEGTKISFDKEVDIKDDLNTINFGLVGGIGAGYSFGRHGIWLDGRYNMGMLNIYQNTSTNGENSTGSIMALLGYTYTISK